MTPRRRSGETREGTAAISPSIFTIAGKKFLAVHAKWIGRRGQPGAKLRHGTTLSSWAMRALRRLDGPGDAG